jgi:hypothetical protein
MGAKDCHLRLERSDELSKEMEEIMAAIMIGNTKGYS